MAGGMFSPRPPTLKPPRISFFGKQPQNSRRGPKLTFRFLISQTDVSSSTAKDGDFAEFHSEAASFSSDVPNLRREHQF